MADDIGRTVQCQDELLPRQRCWSASARQPTGCFTHRGIRAVGVNTIVAEIGISKRTLYNYFPSKDDLIIAYLSRRLRPTEVSDLPPARQILDDFDRLERAMRHKGYRGCPFMNAVTELADPTHAAHRFAVAHRERRWTLLRNFLNQLGADDPAGLASQLVILGEGAVAQALVLGDPKMAHAAREAARVLLTAAGVPARRRRSGRATP
jgi:AcrR family transcriptional regulator